MLRSKTIIIPIAVLFALRIIWLWFAKYDLYGDEAQYWIWSQNLDLGYYSKPPMIAWVIRVITSICGNSEFCIRLASSILHLGTCFLIYKIAKELFTKEIALYSSLTYFTLPSVSFSSGLISTEPILLFFWSLTLLLFLKATRTKRLSYWICTGIAAGFGMLSKYNMSIFLLSITLLLFFSNRYRAQLKNLKFWLAIFIAFLIWLPNIVWNWQHGMVSFSHTADLAQGYKTHFNFLNLIKFLFEQLAVFGPILFAAYLYYIYHIKRLWQTESDKILVLFSLPFLLIIMAIAFYSRAHANWAAPTYIAATILVARQLLKDDKAILLNISIITHLILSVILMVYVLLLSYNLIPLSASTDLLKQVRGSKEMANQIEQLRKEYPSTIFSIDDRMYYATTVYYTKNNPLNIIKWNPTKRVKDHFDLTSDLNEYKTKDIILISNYYTQREQLLSYAVNVKELKKVEYNPYDGLNKELNVFYLKNFKGF